MRYEDTSGTFSAAGTPDARDDADLLPQGSHAPATGNVVSGAGTTTGEAGADTPGNGLVVALRGAGGTDASDSGASLHVAGRYGTLTMDEHGNYKYVPEPRAPQGVRDVFNYTLETKDGRDTAELVINLGDRITVSENAQRIVPGPDGVVNLPPGVNLSDVHVVGRDLVVTLPDGSQIVIVDGAVFVPQLVLGGVEVPSTNLASLLIENEQVIQPGGGTPQSSGGNFDVPVPPLDPGTPLGDLIPPTELIFGQPRFEEIGQFIDREPEAGSVSVQLDDDDVPGKNGNPGGTGDDVGAPNATTGGSLPGSGGDGALTWDLLSSGAPAGFTYIDGPNGSILVQQVQDGNPVTVLTITIDAATGAFTVTENNPVRHAAGDNENNALFTINYTVTDSDGDTAPGTLNINVDDDTPTVSVTAGSDANVSLTTHDALTIGAGSEAVSTTADFSNVFGATSFSPGADGAGPGTTSGYALSTTGGASGLFSHGIAINLYNVGGVIVGSTSTTAPATATDASVVFSVSTTNTGIVTLTQFAQIDHTADQHPTDAPFTDDIMSLADGAITLTRSLTVVDKDGDSVTGSAAVQIGANLHFVDDGPSIGLADHGEPSATVDETNLGTNATADFSANFSASFGADGPAANSITYALGISAPGANSGLIDVATGQAIVLVLNGAVVEGHVGTAAGALALTVSVDASGVVTLDQILALQHPDGTNPDDSVTLSADTLVTLTATAHDFDGDTAAATLNIGTNLNFEDDGPTIELSGTQHDLTVDETDLVTNAGPTSFADAFTSSFGADGAGAVTYALTILSPGVNSGLIDSATGLPIVLVNNGGVIEGHVNTAGGALAFTISVDAAGNVSLDQILALQHPNQLNPDDSVTLSADNLISLTATVTDKDGDSQSATLDIGQNLHFEDDGPDANNDTDTIPSGGTTATGNVISGVGTNEGAGNADSSGADSPAHVTAIQGAGGTDTTFSAGLLSIGGSHGTLNIDADGNYTYNRAPGSPGGVDDVFTYTLTDADGDSVTATLTIHIDDATPHTDPNPPVGLDDDALANGNPGGTGDDPNSVNASGTLSGSGGDGALTFAVQTTGAPAGFTYISGGAGIVLIQQGGVTVLTVTVGSNGSYSVVQNAPIDHVAGSDENNSDFTINYTVTDVDGDGAPGTLNISVDDDTPLAFNDTDITNPVTDTAVGNVISGVGTIEGAANADKPGADGYDTITNLVGFGGSSDNDPAGGFSVNGQFGTLQMDANGNYTYTRSGGPGGAVEVFTYTYVDQDGDPATATLTITIADETPVAGNVNVGLDDDALANGNPGGTGDDPDSVNATGNLPGSGGDAPLTFGVLLTGAPAGFSYVSGGAGVVLVQQGGVTVLTVTVNSTTGAYSVVQNAPIDHAVGGDENNQPFTINYTVTDFDNDVANGTISISVDDDTPTVSANAGVQLDDDALAGGNAGGTGDDANATNVSGTLAHSYGADGAGSVAYLTTGAPAGFSYALQGNGDLWVLQGATHVLTLTVNATTGAYTVSQVAPIDHVAGLDENNQAFTINYRVTDGDGDTVDGSISVNVDDDTPTVSANAAVQLDDDALTGGNAGGTGDDPNATNVSGTLAHSYGADGAGSVAYLTTGAPAGFSYALQGNGDLWVLQGATHVLTLTVNASTGAYTVSQVAPISHVAGLDENNQAFTITYRVSDGDGDTVDGSIVVNVDDDTPTVSANAAVQLDDDALTGGNAGGTGDDANATNVSGTLAHSYGADGAGTIAYLTTGAPAGFSYALQGNGDLWVMQGADHVLTLTVNATTGAYSVSQVLPIDHAAGLDENNVSFTINYRVTDSDGDPVDGSIVVNVDDDTPTAAIGTTGQGVSVDESAGVQVDSNDTTSAGVIALFAGVTNIGTDPDMTAQYAQNASAIVNSTGSSVGADTPGTTVFSLNVSAAGVDSGLNTTGGQDILLTKEGDLIIGRVSGGADDGKAAFALAIDPSTGVVSMVEYLSIQHPNAANPDDSVSIANGAVLAVVTVTDADSDSATQSTPIGSLLSFQDSGPIMTGASNINIQNSGDFAHTGTFAFDLGADGAAASNNVITNVTGSATVGGVAVTNYLLSETSENATTAVYSFSFDYGIGGGNTAHETGTLTFNKATGQYTVDLDNPIQGVTTILQTAEGTLFQGYELGTSTPDGSQPAISVTQIQDLAGTANDIYVQFTSVSEPSSGTGDDNLEVTNWVPGANNPAPINGGGDTAWNAGQLFNQVDGWVSTSNSANGVDGDTIQGGEVLDFSLVQGANPTGNLAQPATFAQASAMFLKFDGIGSGEDMIVVLKLYDPNTDTYTTRAIMIENGDIQKGPGAGPGQYSGITLDQNDGLVIIESNDYNNPGENWVIVGAQIAGSDEGVTGTAIDLNSAIGAAGDSDTNNNGSLDTDALGFQSDTNDGPFKISSIGFLTTQTTPQNAHLDFNVTVTDGDGDSITQAIAADVTAAADSSTPISLPPGNTTISQAPLGSKSTAAVADIYQSSHQPATNSNPVLVGALAAAGLSAEPLAAHSVQGDLNSSVSSFATAAYHVQAQAPIALDSSAFSDQLSPHIDVRSMVEAQSSTFHAPSFAEPKAMPDVGFGSNAQGPGPMVQATAMPAHDQVLSAIPLAGNVVMPSAQQLAGLSEGGVAGAQHNQVVAQVLADALHGGGANGATLDALINALPNHGGGANDALASLASQSGGAVSFGDMGVFAGFSAAHIGLAMEHAAMVHQDAAPLHG